MTYESVILVWSILGCIAWWILDMEKFWQAVGTAVAIVFTLVLWPVLLGGRIGVNVAAKRWARKHG